MNTTKPTAHYKMCLSVFVCYFTLVDTFHSSPDGMHNEEEDRDRDRERATGYESTISFDNVAQIKRHWAITNQRQNKTKRWLGLRKWLCSVRASE